MSLVMPCDSIVLNQVELELANEELLMDALEKMTNSKVAKYGNVISFTYEGNSYRIDNKKLICPKGYEKTADLIKQAYSKEVLTKAVKRFGWNMKQVKENKFQLTRKF